VAKEASVVAVAWVVSTEMAAVAALAGTEAGTSTPLAAALPLAVAMAVAAATAGWEPREASAATAVKADSAAAAEVEDWGRVAAWPSWAGPLL
jgi:hypothetical protein